MQQLLLKRIEAQDPVGQATPHHKKQSSVQPHTNHFFWGRWDSFKHLNTKECWALQTQDNSALWRSLMSLWVIQWYKSSRSAEGLPTCSAQGENRELSVRLMQYLSKRLKVEAHCLQSLVVQLHNVSSWKGLQQLINTCTSSLPLFSKHHCNIVVRFLLFYCALENTTILLEIEHLFAKQ